MGFLEINNLKKQFKRVVAVDGIGMEVAKGEILGILGPNGAGKSTTVAMISTLLLPTAGEIFYEGQNVQQMLQSYRRSLGVVPQEVALYADLTGLENLSFFGRIYGLRGEELERRIQEVLEIIGLQGRAKDLVKHYSGGMKRRLNIGAALLHKPHLLIMDEPTVGIDPQSRNHILETVKELNRQGMTVIYTSHYMEEIEFLCNRIYIMDHGKIIAAGTKEELKGMAAGKNVVELKTDILPAAFVQELKGLPVVAEVLVQNEVLHITLANGQNALAELFACAGKHKVSILATNISTTTLETVFLNLTGRGLRD